MIEAFLEGASYFWRGRPLVFARGARFWALAPIVLATLTFGLAIWWAATWFGDLVTWTEEASPGWLDWLGWLLWPLFALSAGLVVYVSFILVANLLAAPFNGTLSEIVEARITGRTPPRQPWSRLVKTLPHTALQETRKLLYYAAWALPFLVISCLFNVVGPVLWFVFSAWMLALEFGDYPMDNHGLPFGEMRRRLRRRPWHALGFGTMTLLAFLVPGLNLVAMPIAVGGATLFWLEQLEDAAG